MTWPLTKPKNPITFDNRTAKILIRARWEEGYLKKNLHVIFIFTFYFFSKCTLKWWGVVPSRLNFLYSCKSIKNKITVVSLRRSTCRMEKPPPPTIHYQSPPTPHHHHRSCYQLEKSSYSLFLKLKKTMLDSYFKEWVCAIFDIVFISSY